MTHQFLKTNSEILDRPEVPAKGGKAAADTTALIVTQLATLKLNADKIGARLIQDVQAGALSAPVFVFPPSNA